MNSKEAKQIYTKISNDIKANNKVYEESVHCPMIIETIASSGRVSAFCKKAKVSNSRVYQWRKNYPIFDECYKVALMIAEENWEEEGVNGRYNPEFNVKIWERQGMNWFGKGNAHKMEIHLGSDSTPWEHYKELVDHASEGVLTAAEFKQCSEVINIGIRAFEAIEMQKQIDEMKEDLTMMGDAYGENVTAINKASKTDKDTVPNKARKWKAK